MRILGYVDHPHCKITIFHMGTKYAVKLENGLYEQTFKLRESAAINNLTTIKSIIDEAFIADVLQRFESMHASMGNTMLRNFPEPDEEEFEEII